MYMPDDHLDYPDRLAPQKHNRISGSTKVDSNENSIELGVLVIQDSFQVFDNRDDKGPIFEEYIQESHADSESDFQSNGDADQNHEDDDTIFIAFESAKSQSDSPDYQEATLIEEQSGNLMLIEDAGDHENTIFPATALHASEDNNQSSVFVRKTHMQVSK